ncbi:LysM peptidoglycan-binding domain-containing protein [Halomonas sp. HP20-15]|uniref:LysM peptidoglycan-binding domain-containing protein n=1 Tax=Halomonas sp. HP20-15 TaxID=3085901 RepID=UPI0029814338|nr:LysM peptidoglycan-binding domain-containing protein [Halomonas sp. HP20-15]MDW5375469.1 LysM peptidoglycan-binding domain-containing protein [Halomonas sp. HP20-15]
MLALTVGAVQAQPQTTPIFWNELALEPAVSKDAWQRLRGGFQWQVDADEPRVQRWLKYYRKHPHSVAAIAQQASPWLYWVMEELERRDMPGEIALLPFIESAYDPTAQHAGGATGLWQLMPGTGDALGLRRDWWYDGRLDVISSTRAALDYLQQQADQWYDGDFELALAAYNAGAGTVNHAIRNALAQGKSGSYWDLRLPRQTMNYVPKLLALSLIIARPDYYGINLPAIADKPAFARVEVPGQIDLEQAAKLAGVSEAKLEALNPGLLQNVTLPRRAPTLLVPTKARETLVSALANQPPQAMASWQRYRVKRGDTLSAIAARHSVPVSVLRQENSLSGDTIRIGQTLRVPLGRETLDTRADTLVVQVQPGDSLSGIAQRHDVAASDIARWNALDSSQYLQPGQRLTLYLAN